MKNDARRRQLEVVVLAILLIVTGRNAHADTAPRLEDKPGFAQLGWSTGTRDLPQSHAVLTVPPHARAVYGAAAASICGCPVGSVDALVRYYRWGSIRFNYDGSAFVGDRDWGTLDPAFLLSSIRLRARELVGTRYTTIYGSTNIIDWGSPPAYDKQRHAVTFMVHVADDNGKEWYDARALVLGRFGHELIMVDSDDPSSTATWNALQRGISAFEFSPGYRYVDHQLDDKTGYIPVVMLLEMESGAKLTEVANPYVVQARIAGGIRIVFLLVVLSLGVLFVVRRAARYAPGTSA